LSTVRVNIMSAVVRSDGVVTASTDTAAPVRSNAVCDSTPL
jgi:hypothetical protein